MKRSSSTKKTQQQSVQIIAGTYRHRRIDFVAVDDLRPTGARVRETLFNWLQPYINGVSCLDLFAGSGILGLEALSRGAQSVTFVEKQRSAAKQLENNVQTLCIECATVLNQDFSQQLAQADNQRYDIIFLDPPYALRLLPQLLKDIEKLSPDWVFIEDNQPFEDWIAAQGGYEIIKSKKSGNIYYGLLCPATA